jgi:hypothetical protein
MGGVDGKAPPRTVNQDRSVESLVGTGFEQAADNPRRRSLRRRGKRRVEARRKQGRAHVNLMSGLAKRKVVLDC